MTVPVFSLHELSTDLKITDLHLQNLDKATRFHSKILLKHISPSSVVGSSRNFRVESKIEMNLLEGLLARKKNLGRHSRSVAIFLKLDFQNGWFLLWISGQSKINVTKYGLTIYHWLGNLMQNDFYKRSTCWKSICSRLSKENHS